MGGIWWCGWEDGKGEGEGKGERSWCWTLFLGCTWIIVEKENLSILYFNADRLKKRKTPPTTPPPTKPPH